MSTISPHNDFLLQLNSDILAVCPIEGISIGDFFNKSTWRISFSLSATDNQKTTAQQILDSYSLPV